MKKLCCGLAFLCALGLVLPADAQIRMGLIGGLNLANVSVNPNEEPEPSNLTTFGVGGVLHINLADNLALQFEPMYLRKGAKQKGSFTDPDLGNFSAEAKTKVDYIEVPVMLKVAFGASMTGPYVMAGPMVGFLLSAKQTGSISFAGVEQEIDEDIKDQITNIDFGLGFGAGLSFPAGNNSLFVEGRYALGLTNINDDPEDAQTEVKTREIQILAGVIFQLGK